MHVRLFNRKLIRPTFVNFSKKMKIAFQAAFWKKLKILKKLDIGLLLLKVAKKHALQQGQWPISKHF